MSGTHHQHPFKTAADTSLKAFLFLSALLFTLYLHAGDISPKVIEVTLGDYRYKPGNIQLTVNQPVIMRLLNVDSFTPHNFTLEDDSDGLDVNVDIPAGNSVDVHLMPLVAGSHSFYCHNQLWPMDSHREKGMAGILRVSPKPQAE